MRCFQAMLKLTIIIEYLWCHQDTYVDFFLEESSPYYKTGLKKTQLTLARHGR